MSADLLRTIVAASRKAAVERERVLMKDGAAFERAVAAAAPRGDRFRTALTGPGIRVVAECKRRSPSRGVLRSPYDPAGIAAAYEQAGAAAISVLTEPTFFDGSLDHLRDVRRRVRLPILRKDFLVTSFQLREARAAGADAVLLIAAALDPAALRELLREAGALGMAALVEVHDRPELDAALEAGAALVGVNSRNLRTLEMNPDVLDALADGIPDEAIAVAESGLKSADDLTRLAARGYDAFLIGERLMTSPDPGEALGRLLGRHARSTA
jgi:indole-3-glycerol phosphate synthase